MKSINEYINESIDPETIALGVILGIAGWRVIVSAIKLGAIFTIKGLIKSAKDKEAQKYFPDNVKWSILSEIAEKIDIEKCPTCKAFPTYLQSGGKKGIIEPSDATKTKMAEEMIACLTDENDINELKKIFNIK